MTPKNKFNTSNGITLISLVVTIVVLLILASVSLTSVIGNNGILTKAQEAKFKTELSAIQEQYLSSSFNYTESKDINQSLPIADQIRGFTIYSNNCQDAFSMIQTAKGALNEDVAILNRMLELIEQANNTVEVEDKQSILLELNALIEVIDEIAEDVNFSGQQLLNQDKIITFYYENQQYMNVKFGDFRSEILNLNIDISSSQNIQTSRDNVNNAIATIQNKIAEFDENEEFLTNKSNELSEKAENLEQYTNSDNIELSQLQQNGELESEKISKIEDVLVSVEDSINIIQTAEGQCTEIYSKLLRMYELAVHASNETTSSDNRVYIQDELNTLKDEINTIVSTTTYGGYKLLDGTYSNDKSIGIDGESITIAINSCYTSNLGQNNTAMYIDVSNAENAKKSEQSIDEAIDNIYVIRSQLLALKNRLEHTSSYYSNLKDLLNSRIENEETRRIRISLVGCEEIQSCLSRIRELLIQSQGIGNSQLDKQFIFMEVEQLLQETNRIANYTKDKETSLLNGEYDVKINLTNVSLGINGIVLDTVENTIGQINNVESAIIEVFTLRQKLAIKEGTYTSTNYEIEGKWADKLKIINGKLVYIGTNDKEKEWAKEIGISVED